MDVEVVCRKCQRNAPSSSMVLDPDYEMMVCPECVKAKRQKPSVDAIDEPKKSPFKCAECGYTFSSTEKPEKCAYCGKEGKIMDHVV